MKILTKTCEYGIRSLICIAVESEEGKIVSQTFVAKHIGAPVTYTAKILQKLNKLGFVKSKRGATGGFYVERGTLDQLTLWKVATELDASVATPGCLLGLDSCSDKTPCPVHAEYADVRNRCIQLLKTTKLSDLANKVHQGEALLTV